MGIFTCYLEKTRGFYVKTRDWQRNEWWPEYIFDRVLLILACFDIYRFIGVPFYLRGHIIVFFKNDDKGETKVSDMKRELIGPHSNYISGLN